MKTPDRDHQHHADQRVDAAMHAALDIWTSVTPAELRDPAKRNQRVVDARRAVACALVDHAGLRPRAVANALGHRGIASVLNLVATARAQAQSRTPCRTTPQDRDWHDIVQTVANAIAGAKDAPSTTPEPLALHPRPRPAKPHAPAPPPNTETDRHRYHQDLERMINACQQQGLAIVAELHTLVRQWLSTHAHARP